ncbi:MAG: rod shape-determining protein MreD [Thermodesulfovibrionales bacterium]|nr:rod shape-determining protein MreD [Thermodesulfovibrionales bacterium]
MKYLLWAGITFLTFGIQGSISLFDITPNFTVILASYAGIREKELKGLFFGSLIGIVEDSLSGTFLGPNLLSKGLVGYLAAFLYSKFFVWNPVLGMLTVSLLTIVDSFIVYTARSIFDTMPSGIGAAAFIIAMQALYNAPLGIFLKKKSEQ